MRRHLKAVLVFTIYGAVICGVTYLPTIRAIVVLKVLAALAVLAVSAFFYRLALSFVDTCWPDKSL